MKNFIFLLLGIALLFCQSCTKEELAVTEDLPIINKDDENHVSDIAKAYRKSLQSIRNVGLALNTTEDYTDLVNTNFASAMSSIKTPTYQSVSIQKIEFYDHLWSSCIRSRMDNMSEENETIESAIQIICEETDHLFSILMKDNGLNSEEKRSIAVLLEIRKEISMENILIIQAVDNNPVFASVSRRRCWIWKRIRKILTCTAISATATACFASGSPPTVCVAIAIAAADCWARPCSKF